MRTYRKLSPFALLIALAVWGRGNPARAEAFSLSGIETTTVSALFDSLASAFAFRPAEPASSLGSKWGFYAGVGFSATNLDAVSSTVSGLSTSYLPGAEVSVGLGLPFGITIETGFLPSISYSGTSISKTAGAVKWNLNSRLKKFPLQLAVRALYNSASIAFTQTDGSGTSSVGYGTTHYGLNFVVSKNLGFTYFGIEPYLGAGCLNQSSNITASGTANVFGSSFPVGTASTSSSGLSFTYQAGVLLRLGIIGLSAEYDHLFGVNSYGGKVALRF